MSRVFEKIENIVAPVTLISLVLYFFLKLISLDLGFNILLLALIFGVIPLFFGVLYSLYQKNFGVDIVALASITGCMLLGEYLAGTVILLMMAGGNYLENYALGKSRKELNQLLNNAPKIAHLMISGQIKDIQAAQVKVNDILIIKSGEVIPVDGLVVKGESSVNEANITGESLPVSKSTGALVMSGTVNLDNILEIKATKTSKQSKYQQIVKLILEAEENRAPFVRLADKYSLWFTAITFSIALLAYIFTGDPVRALTVLVVATPCPLILATPVAFASGISKAASRGLIFKSGGAIEQLANAKAFVFDKTGTITLGKLQVMEIKKHDNIQENTILQIAASLDQLSEHIVAKALVSESKARNLPLSLPHDFKENFGKGVSGNVNGIKYFLGKLSYLKASGVKISEEVEQNSNNSVTSGEMQVFLSTEENVVGCIKLADKPRVNVANLFKLLRLNGVKKILMLTGDKQEVAEIIAKRFGIEEFQAQCMPGDKVKAVNDLRRNGFKPVIMVGDGVNDAPALASSDCGIAVSDARSNATSEVGDIVLINNDINRIGEVYLLSKNVLSVAKQSIFIGIGVSILLMIIGSFGTFTPVAGAFMQEFLDVFVILNALRVNLVKLEN